MQEETQETGLLGGASEEDFKTPQEQEDTSVNVFESNDPKPITVERPEGLPEQFWDSESGTFKGNDLFEEYKKEKDKSLGLRQKLSKGIPSAPESPESYQVNAENLADTIGYEIPEGDIGLDIFKKVAFENGLAQEQFEAIYTGYMKEALNNKDFQKENESNPEPSEEDTQAYLKSEMEKLGPDATAVVQGIKNFNQQLLYDGLISKEDFSTAQNMGMSASEVRVMNAYRMKAGDISIPESPSSIDGMESELEIRNIMSSPEYENDPALQKKVSDFYIKKHS